MSKIYNPIINILIITLVIYIAVDIFYRIARAGLHGDNNSEAVILSSNNDESVTGRNTDDFQIIIDRNIFGSLEDVSQETARTPVETLEPTKLKISLLGTVSGSSENAVAVIEEKDKKTQGLFRVGDSIQDAVVKTILRGKVVLRLNGRDEILVMSESSSSEPLPSKTEETQEVSRLPSNLIRRITIRQNDLDSLSENTKDLMTQAQIQPHQKDGKLEGFTITGIKSGSVFRRMGLRNGDIITAINESPITSPDEILTIFEGLESGLDMSLQIERRGQQRTLNYIIR